VVKFDQCRVRRLLDSSGRGVPYVSLATAEAVVLIVFTCAALQPRLLLALGSAPGALPWLRQLLWGVDSVDGSLLELDEIAAGLAGHVDQDRKSTRLNSSHVKISYAVFCLKKKINQVYRDKLTLARG